MSTSPPRLLAPGNSQGAGGKTSATIRLSAYVQELRAGTDDLIVVDLADRRGDATRPALNLKGESDA
ncbi:hypothetical protein ACFV9C_42180 [Kribbella sp. NPDC059898]|uniref:hypothetical protein n=1 Tax=Kribbella sp. NPDC059898 TaxID=3346995 RepID=UPI0036647F87